MYDANDLIGKESILYKLTDKDGYTRRYETNQTLWMVGLRQTIDSVYDGYNDLCSPNVFHAYLDPHLALIFNPLHAGFNDNSMRLFKAKGTVVAVDGIEKVGVKSLEPIEELAVSKVCIGLREEIAFNVLAKIPGLPENLMKIISSRIVTTDKDIDSLSERLKTFINLKGLFYRAYRNHFLLADLGLLLKVANNMYKVDVIDIMNKTIAAQSGQ